MPLYQGYGFMKQPTFIVAADGTGDFDNVNDAIDNLTSVGGSIFIKEGTYTISETMVLPSNLSLIGSGFGTILKLKDNYGGTTGYGFDIIYSESTSNIIIRNLQIDGNKSNNGIGAFYGIHLNGVSHAKIEGCYIKDLVNHGLWIYNSTDVSVISNRIETCTGYGIYLRTDSDRGIVIGNKVYQSGEYGIVLDSCDYCVVDDNYEEGSGQTGANGYGIYVASSNRCSVTANKTVDDLSVGIALSGNFCSITSNQAYSAGANGILIAGTNNSVGENSVSSSTGSQIYITAATYCSVYGNVAVNGSSNGIRLSNVSGNNTISVNNTNTNASYGIRADLGCDGNIISSNIMKNNTAGSITDLGAGNVVSDNME